MSDNILTRSISWVLDFIRGEPTPRRRSDRTTLRSEGVQHVGQRTEGGGAIRYDHHAFHEDAKPGDLSLQFPIRWRSSSKQFRTTISCSVSGSRCLINRKWVSSESISYVVWLPLLS